MKLIRFKDLKKRLRKLAKMKAEEAIRLGLTYLHGQIKIRPRVRFLVLLISVLTLAFLFSSLAIAYIKPKEAKIKIRGQAILVADRTTEKNEPDLAISQTIDSKRAPFEFQYPVDGYISQRYTFYHQANDIATSLGTPIRPLGPGVIEFAGRLSDGRGNVVIIDHGDGLKSLYAHMGRITVGAGNQVNSKISIGTVGLTGRTTGAHVHLEILDNNKTIDPESILPQ